MCTCMFLVLAQNLLWGSLHLILCWLKTFCGGLCIAQDSLCWYEACQKSACSVCMCIYIYIYIDYKLCLATKSPGTIALPNSIKFDRLRSALPLRAQLRTRLRALLRTRLRALLRLSILSNSIKLRLSFDQILSNSIANLSTSI